MTFKVSKILFVTVHKCFSSASLNQFFFNLNLSYVFVETLAPDHRHDQIGVVSTWPVVPWPLRRHGRMAAAHPIPHVESLIGCVGNSRVVLWFGFGESYVWCYVEILTIDEAKITVGSRTINTTIRWYGSLVWFKQADIFKWKTFSPSFNNLGNNIFGGVSHPKLSNVRKCESTVTNLSPIIWLFEISTRIISWPDCEAQKNICSWMRQRFEYKSLWECWALSDSCDFSKNPLLTFTAHRLLCIFPPRKRT